MRARIHAADPQGATVEQAADGELDNHLGVRHASALYAGAYAASRALVLAALAAHRPGAPCRMTSSELSYRRIPKGVIRNHATPAGDEWELLATGEELELHTEVVSVGEDGKVVLELSATWSVGESSTHFA